MFRPAKNESGGDKKILRTKRRSCPEELRYGERCWPRTPQPKRSERRKTSRRSWGTIDDRRSLWAPLYHSRGHHADRSRLVHPERRMLGQIEGDRFAATLQI